MKKLHFLTEHVKENRKYTKITNINKEALVSIMRVHKGKRV